MHHRLRRQPDRIQWRCTRSPAVFLYGAFVAKVVVVRHRRWPGWARSRSPGARSSRCSP
ncbi:MULTISPECIES: DUF6529 family protein [unclassified Streptomyces]|uniref:DUF6529 family protein n=1 Tax=unclassified Streptomyces TaxID=2593676 RepID=UPI0033CFFF6C